MDKRLRIQTAVISALRIRGYTYADVANILGRSVGTVSNCISKGNFSPKLAREWSQKLDIPESVFLEGDSITPDTGVQITELRKKIEDLENELNRLIIRVYRLEERR